MYMNQMSVQHQHLEENIRTVRVTEIDADKIAPVPYAVAPHGHLQHVQRHAWRKDTLLEYLLHGSAD